MKTSLAYKLLLLTALLILNVSVFGQSARKNFKAKFNESMQILKEDSEKAASLALESYLLAKEFSDTWAMAMGKSGLGYISKSSKVRDYETAFMNYSEALALLRESDTTDLFNEAAILQHLASIHSKYGNYDASIKLREEALVISDDYLSAHPDHAKEYGQLGISRDITYFLATAYHDKGAHQTAGEILMNLWNEAENKKDVVSYARVLNKLGIIKKKNGEYTDALEYFSLVIAAKGVSKKYKSIAYHNLAETYMVQGNYSKAEGFYSIALGLKEDLGNARSTFITYLGMGELAYKKNQVTEAIGYWETALSLFSKVDADPELYAIYNWLQLAYMDVDIARAKEFNAEYVKLIDFHNRSRSIQNGEDANQREALSLLIDQQKQNRVSAAERKQFVRQFWPVFLGVGLLVLFSMVLGFRYYMALRANKLLTRGLLQPQQAQIHGASLVSEKD